MTLQENITLKERIIEHNGIEYKVVNYKDGKIKLSYNLGDNEEFEISGDSPLYKEILNLELKNNKTDETKNIILENTEKLLGTYNINDLKENINIDIEGEKLNFYFNKNLVGVVEFSFNSNETDTIFLDFIGSINTKKNDFDELDKNIVNEIEDYFYKNFDGFKDIKINGLGKYIYEEFINFIKNENTNKDTNEKIKYIKSKNFNEKLDYIIMELKENGTIHNSYLNSDGINIIEIK